MLFLAVSLPFSATAETKERVRAEWNVQIKPPHRERDRVRVLAGAHGRRVTWGEC